MSDKRRGVWALGDEETKTPYQYKACGLDDIWLISGYELEDVDGEPAVTIRNLDGLHEAIGRSLVGRKKILNGKEIRFLRRQMDLTQSELARLVGCDAQQIARYEKGTNRIPGPADRILRMLFLHHLGGDVPVRDILKELDEMDSRIEEPRRFFQETPDGHWKAAA